MCASTATSFLRIGMQPYPFFSRFVPPTVPLSGFHAVSLSFFSLSYFRATSEQPNISQIEPVFSRFAMFCSLSLSLSLFLSFFLSRLRATKSQRSHKAIRRRNSATLVSMKDNADDDVYDESEMVDMGDLSMCIAPLDMQAFSTLDIRRVDPLELPPYARTVKYNRCALCGCVWSSWLLSFCACLYRNYVGSAR